jgi:hypothetical protein
MKNVICVEEKRYVEDGIPCVDMKIIHKDDVAFMHVGALLTTTGGNIYMVMNPKEAVKIVDVEKIRSSVNLLKEHFMPRCEPDKDADYPSNVKITEGYV